MILTVVKSSWTAPIRRMFILWRRCPSLPFFQHEDEKLFSFHFFFFSFLDYSTPSMSNDRIMSTFTSNDFKWDVRLDIFTSWWFQALKLAEYKPIIDVQSLPETLQEVEDTSTAAQLFFKGIRMKVVYYEDLIMNPKVGIVTWLTFFTNMLPHFNAGIVMLVAATTAYILSWEPVQPRLFCPEYTLIWWFCSIWLRFRSFWGCRRGS